MESRVYTFLLDVDGNIVTMFDPAKNKAEDPLDLVGLHFMGISMTIYSLDRNMDRKNGKATHLAQFLMDVFIIKSVEIMGDVLVRVHIESPYPMDQLQGMRKVQIEKILDEAHGFCSMKESGDMPEALKAWLDTMIQQGHGEEVSNGIKLYGQYI